MKKNHFAMGGVMFRDICRVFVLALVAGAVWSCGGDRVTQSQVAEEQGGRPLSKVTVGMSEVVVMARVHETETPVSGVMVEFSRSVAGQSASYDWSGMTDDEGQVQIEITGGSGYYQARAVRDGSEIDSWSSIPLNAGAEVLVDLPIGGRAQVMGSSGEMPPSADPRDVTQAYVEAGIARYERDGLEATVAYYNSPKSIEGERHMFMLQAGDKTVLAAALFPQFVGKKGPFPIPPGIEDGQLIWLESRNINAVTMQEEPALVLLVIHDGIVFISSHSVLSESLVSVTVDYVQKAIDMYNREGRDATVAYYNSRESIEGQHYLFLVDENDLYLVHPIFPHLRGTDIKDVVGSDGYELGKEIAQATEEGRWIEYLWPHPVTGVEEPKGVWVIRHDGLIFASGYYTPDPNIESPPWKDADPVEYTVTYVEQAIARYEREGLDAMVNYYNSVASFHGQWYMFIIDASDLYIVHPIFPQLIGTDIKNVVGSDGQELGKEIAQATEEGHWVEYLWPHPSTLLDAHKVAYVVRHDGLIFASGYYPVVEDPRAYTIAYVEKAIEYYKENGREATVAYYNSGESIDKDWYLVLLDENDLIMTNVVFPNLIGLNHQSVGMAAGFVPIGDGEVIDATEEGKWFSYSFFNVGTSENDQMHTWAIRYDGLIFTSSYFSGD